jgi:Methyltransferase domain
VTRASLRPKAHPKGEFHEWDVMAVELEVAEFLYALVRAAKPRLVVEAGTGRGIAATFIAEALRDNGAGQLVTYEPDPRYAAEAHAALEGLPADVREGRSFGHEGEPPQVVFIDSLGGYRREDIEFWLAREPLPLVIVHDANRDYGLTAGARLTAGRGVWMLGSA